MYSDTVLVGGYSKKVLNEKRPISFFQKLNLLLVSEKSGSVLKRSKRPCHLTFIVKSHIVKGKLKQLSKGY